MFWIIEINIQKIIIERKRLGICYRKYNSWVGYRPISRFLSFMLRPKYENNLRILIFTISVSEIEIEHKTPSWVWDLLVKIVITTPGLPISSLYYGASSSSSPNATSPPLVPIESVSLRSYSDAYPCHRRVSIRIWT